MSTVTPSSSVDDPISMDVPADVVEDVLEGSLEDKAVNPPPEPEAAATGAAVWDPLNALTAGTAEPAARFRYDVRSGDWWWSPGMFDLHGLTEGDVEPSTELLMSHKHPEDRAATEDRKSVV